MATGTRLTLDEFLKLPETEPASEFICGEVAQKPMGTLGHSFLQGFLYHFIFQFLITTRLGRVGTEVRCVFRIGGRERALVPDVAFISNARLQSSGVYAVTPLEGAPDLAIEVLSPDQNPREFAAKIDFYLRHGVRLVWVIHPFERVITVHRPDADPREIGISEALDGEDVLPGFLAPVADIFAQLDE